MSRKSGSQASLLSRHGRIVQTVSLLQYLRNADLQQTMQAATNTSDAFHRVVPWLFLGEAGNIASKDRATQRKPITYNHLIANGVLFHDMHAQTRLFHPPAHEGHAVDQGVLAHLSPDLTARVNRVGSYTVKCGRQVPSPN